MRTSKITLTFLIFAAFCTGALFFGTAYGEEAPRTVFVHLFEWRWDDIAKECETFLGPNGYAAVQVSPPNEHRIVGGRPWWERYQPVSYALVSRSGNREQFEDMVKRCNAAGVKIYVDAVINHMTGPAFGNDAAYGKGSGASQYSYYSYPIYSDGDFHVCRRDISNYGDRTEVQECNLLGLADLDTGSDYVRRKISEYLNDMASIGVAGFRIDAAKHMSTNDIREILTRVQGSPAIYQEVIEAGEEPITGSEYFQNGLVTEFDYGRKIADFFIGGRLASLKSFEESWQELMPSYRAVVFIDNHDTQRKSGAITYKNGRMYDLANVFMLAWPYGYPKVMSSYAFETSDQGPPSTNGETNRIYQGDTPNCFNEWKCEHRWRPIANMVKFRNSTVSAWRVDNWWDNGNNQIAFGRGDKGFVVINKEPYPLDRILQTGLLPGDYCNAWDGELKDKRCTGTVITVNPDGTALFHVEPWTAAAIHVGSRTTPVENVWKRTVVFVYGKSVPGQDMFIRGGIDHEYANAQLARNCSTSNFNCAVPIRHRNLRNETTNLWKKGEYYLDWYGKEGTQNEKSHGIYAEGSPLDWTTDKWPDEWGEKRTVPVHGFGEEALNKYGLHYWMFDVDMDCSKTANGWFEFKSYISNGPGWEKDIKQTGAPYASKNHFAKCGHINVFKYETNEPVKIITLAE